MAVLLDGQTQGCEQMGSVSPALDRQQLVEWICSREEPSGRESSSVVERQLVVESGSMEET